MRQRIIGVLYVALLFIPSYFLLNGDLFPVVLFLWIGVAYSELNLSCNYSRIGFRKGNYTLAPCYAFSCFFCIAAMFACFFIDNKKLIALGIIACFISDTCGYIVGKIFGKNNKVSFLRNVSPNKSYAGFIGAVILAIPLVYLSAKILKITEISDARLITFAILSGFLAASGDLIGSATKRFLGIKDSGEDFAKIPHLGIIEMPLVGGHGGYYDRADSFTVQLVFVWLLLSTQASP